jgi:uncharacterized peroxidase-related enzyme
MTHTQPTLTPNFSEKDPYLWLTGDPSFRFPDDVREQIQVPEKNSMEILASFNVAGNERGGAYMTPIFLDPEYGLLTLAEREFIGVVVSATNSCTTCLIIHCQKLGEHIGDHGRARRIAINYRAVSLSAEERAIADYCVKLSEWPGRLEESDLKTLRSAGISDEKIYYIIEVAAVFNLTNRMTSGYGMRPDDEFLVEISPPCQPLAV